MKKMIIFVLIIFTSTIIIGQKKMTKKDFKDMKSKISYSIGINIGKQIKQHKEDFTTEFLLAGIRDAIEKDSNFVLSDNEIRDAMETYQRQMSERFTKEQNELAEKNKKESEAFLAENKNKPGVVTLPSGLQYSVIKSGNGPKPTDTSKIKVHYTGKLINGKVFDSSVERGEPISFSLKGVIKGWQEALPLMSVGDKWILFIPSELAYGERGAGEIIGPNQALIFEVELLDIED